ncbi:hypothetical protein WJT74_00735 [Sphingomicrobium sp. XHP0239]|uniref:hypothetical protein n=1 Tax=Sphingomicrobium maritimum TaxID=3133972 RepID=UPI0031CC5324
MRIAKRYLVEYSLLAGVSIVSVLGFWDFYFGREANPQPYHHLHVITVFLWLLLLLVQLNSISNGGIAKHRRNGLFVLFMAPFLIATVASLSVLSARRAAASGTADPLLVQNVMVSLQLGLLVVLAFLFKKRRAVHGSLLFSTLILFGGIAVFFALLSFVPMFRIDGPETFYRFGTAAITGLVICVAVSLSLFVSAPKTRWPYLLAAGFFLFNVAINGALSGLRLDSLATDMVGSLDPLWTFAGAFVVQFTLLALLVSPITRPSTIRQSRR